MRGAIAPRLSPPHRTAQGSKVPVDPRRTGYPAGGVGGSVGAGGVVGGGSRGGSRRRTPPVVPIDGASAEFGRLARRMPPSGSTNPLSTNRPIFWASSVSSSGRMYLVD